MRIFTFDTTLRDGTQGEAVSFTSDDKLLIAQKLDELGIDYIEGGWPGSNLKDKDFFARARELNLKHARLVAFGATRFSKKTVQEDASVQAMIEAATPVVSIFGKSWDLHVAPRARHHRRRKSADDFRDRALSEGSRQGSGLRRRAFLRRLSRQPRFRAADARSRE